MAELHRAGEREREQRAELEARLQALAQKRSEDEAAAAAARQAAADAQAAAAAEREQQAEQSFAEPEQEPEQQPEPSSDEDQARTQVREIPTVEEPHGIQPDLQLADPPGLPAEDQRTVEAPALVIPPEPATSVVVGEEIESPPAEPRKRFRRFRRRHGRGQTVKCAVCSSDASGTANDDALKELGWIVAGDARVCPDCQHEGWTVPEGSPLPTRVKAEG